MARETLEYKGYLYLIADNAWQSLDIATIAERFDVKSIKNTAGDIKTVGGRGCSFLYTTQDHTKLVYRSYRRGGLIGRLLRDSFFKYARFAHRAFDELELLQTMRALNMPVPEALAARESRGLLFIKQDIIIKQIENTQNLCQLLMKKSLNDRTYSEILNTCALLYKNKIVHSDLNIKNILIDNNKQIYIIDFDKCYIDKNMSKDLYVNMLNRLLRSFEKEQNLHQESFYFNKDTFVKLMHSHLDKI